MTLYWWMHWFWITVVLVYIQKASTLSSNDSKTKAASNDSKLVMFETKIKYGPEIENEAAIELDPPRKSKAIGTPRIDHGQIPEKTVDMSKSEVNLDNKTSDPTPTPPFNKTISIVIPANSSNSDNHTGVTETYSTGSVSVSTVADDEESETSEEVSVQKKFTSSMLHVTPASVLRPNLNSNLTEKRVESASFGVAAITGTSFGVLIIVALVGTISFIMYRRRYLNKPQTLNDKCSNLDSNGYIDDSTLRENSEEMYSLDNDSFLNSLEAMTIQNYWTDSVKHTKL